MIYLKHRRKAFTIGNSFIFTILTLVEDDTFTLPIYNGGSYDFNVDWGDSSNDDITAWDDAAVTHTYADAGATEYTITITGIITGWRFNNGGDKLLMKDIQSWGPLLFGNLQAYFTGCTNLTVSATDILDITATTNCTNFFRSCSSLTTVPSINSWDWSSVTHLTSAWEGAVNFDQDLSGFDVTALVDATDMFTEVTLSTANYSALLIGWEAQAVLDNVRLSDTNSKYSAGAAATAKADLIADHNWTIIDDGQE